MRTTSKLFMAGLIALGMISCNKENSIDGNERQEQVFMQLSIEMPETRSETDDPNLGQGDSNSNANSDIEEGTTTESDIKNVQMYLLNPKSKAVVAKSIVDPAQMVKAGSMVTIPFKAQELVAYVENGGTQIESVIYVNGLPANYNVNEQSKVVIEAMDKLNIASATAGFWMTNANRNTIVTDLPDLKTLLSHNTAGNPFTIKPLDVERTAARFDVATADEQNTFPVMQGDVATLNVVMDEVALFNMSNDFYRLRRVSDNGLNPDLTTAKTIEANYQKYLFGTETKANYVVDTDEASETFSYVTADDLVWTSIKSLRQAGQADSWQNNSGEVRPDYYVWRYATENTTTLGRDAKQNKSTGVAYRGHIAANDQTDRELAAVINAGDSVIYTLNNVLWGSYEMIAAAATGTEQIEETLKTAYEFAEACKKDKTWEPTLSGVERHNAAVKAAGFIAYVPSADKQYEVYYNYYNRHNDIQGAGKDVAVPMKYGVVRNNVYKLKVKSVSLLGTPEWKQPEDKPIESEEVFFQVSVTILPWTVRINDIEF